MDAWMDGWMDGRMDGWTEVERERRSRTRGNEVSISGRVHRTKRAVTLMIAHCSFTHRTEAGDVEGF
jgi:hypothetical protein